MKFHDYKTLYELFRSGARGATTAEFYEAVKQECLRRDPSHDRDSSEAKHYLRSIAEDAWYTAARPYYKVWPAIYEQLAGFRLDVPSSAVNLNGLGALCLRFCEANPPLINGNRISSVLLHVRQEWRCLICSIEFAAPFENRMFAYGFVLPAEKVLEDELEQKDKAHQPQATLRMAIAISLLADDPSIITPDVLAKDRDRYDRETDEAWRQRAVDRARRRGVVGWNIGADYEVCPHYRRPHFGLRHTGKGRTVPRIVPIKGAVVHRSRLTEVPTGYMLPDGTEVEHGQVIAK